MLPEKLQRILAQLSSMPSIQVLTNKSNVYIVGGSTRDSFLDKPIKDLDLVVEGLTLEEIQKLLWPYGDVNEVGESFGVIKFKPKGWQGEAIDIAVPRTDKKIGKGHKGFEVVTKDVTILEDLKRRDFTINSIAVNIKTKEIIDPFNGVQDIKKKIIRATNPQAFIEDPLRMLRAIQFSARFHFDIDLTTKIQIAHNCMLLKEISGERILDELNKVLYKNGDTKLTLELLYETDLDKGLFGKKFISNDFSEFYNLDPVSFYFIFGTLGDKTPSEFYSSRLRGTAEVTKALQTLEKIFDNLSGKDLKWKIFQMIRTSSLLIDAKVLPPKVQKVIDEMKEGIIPMIIGNIPVTGDDVIEAGKDELSGPQIGQILVQLYKDALDNKFNWINREPALSYMNTIVKNFLTKS